MLVRRDPLPAEQMCLAERLTWRTSPFSERVLGATDPSAIRKPRSVLVADLGRDQ